MGKIFKNPLNFNCYKMAYLSTGRLIYGGFNYYIFVTAKYGHLMRGTGKM